MEREIIFMALDAKTTEWRTGSFVTWEKDGAVNNMIYDQGNGYNINRATLCQFAGLYYESKRVFEGSIIMDLLHKSKYVVAYDRDRYKFVCYALPRKEAEWPALLKEIMQRRPSFTPDFELAWLAESPMKCRIVSHMYTELKYGK